MRQGQMLWHVLGASGLANGWRNLVSSEEKTQFFQFQLNLYVFHPQRCRYASGSSAYEKRIARKTNKKERWQQGRGGIGSQTFWII